MDTPALIPEIAVPVLAVAGSEDTAVPGLVEKVEPPADGALSPSWPVLGRHLLSVAIERDESGWRRLAEADPEPSLSATPRRPSRVGVAAAR